MDFDTRVLTRLLPILLHNNQADQIAHKYMSQVIIYRCKYIKNTDTDATNETDETDKTNEVECLVLESVIIIEKNDHVAMQLLTVNEQDGHICT